MIKSLISGAFVAAFTATAAVAAPVIPNDSGEPTLQEILDDITTSGVGIDVIDDQITADYFGITGSGGSVSTFVIEITAGASTQSAGIFDKTDPTKRVELFGGSATTGSQVVVSILLDGSVRVNFADTGIDFAGNAFGFFMETGGGNVFYSDEALNGGVDRSVIIEGDNDTNVQVGGFAPGLFTDSEYIIAFEDGSDFDFQDLVFITESIEPVSEPGLLGLFGLGLIGLGFAARRRG